MPLVECLVAMQASQQGSGGDSPAVGFILVALIAFVLGLMVYLLVRTSAKRSSKP